VLGLVAFSHWILDLVVHRGDLPILIGNVGNLPTLGFGLWRYPTVSALVELVLVLGGSWLYWQAARRTAEAHGGEKRRLADLAGGVMLIFGLGTLLADWTGFLA
jgi:hypothetical protein